MKPDRIRLGVNIDHIATLRNARAEADPSLLEMAFIVQEAGAHSITVHLREDRRHIQDADLPELKKHMKIPINLEMALTREMLDNALAIAPKSVCIVPERRNEITTEGGLNAKTNIKKLREYTSILQNAGITVFPFINHDDDQLQVCADCGVDGVEIHTGHYARSFFEERTFRRELTLIHSAAEFCLSNNLEFHAGHGLNYQNIEAICQIENLVEVNIGHAIISHSLKVGLFQAVKEMKGLLQ